MKSEVAQLELVPWHRNGSDVVIEIALTEDDSRGVQLDPRNDQRKLNGRLRDIVTVTHGSSTARLMIYAQYGATNAPTI